MNGDGLLTVDDVTLLVKAVMAFNPADNDCDNAGMDFVDLGLTSRTLWATCNIGANRPEDNGQYFAWGETKAKDLHYQGNYKFNNDVVTTLPADADAAHVLWGGAWRLPTPAEMEELLRECSWEWRRQGTAYGYLVTSKTNHASIFLPAAGESAPTPQGQNNNGYYWTNSISTADKDQASCLNFTNTNAALRTHDRCSGGSIRPVLSGSTQK